MKIHERTKENGALVAVVLRQRDGVLAIDGAPLPPGALDAVMKKFGAPLEPGEAVTDVDALDLGDGRRLRHVRHLSRFDVIARDYLIYEAPGAEALCVIAPTVAGALAHLATAAAPST